MNGVLLHWLPVGAPVPSAVISGVKKREYSLEKTGIAMTYRLIGIIWVAVLILAVLILGKAQPVATDKDGVSSTDGMTQKEAMRSPML